MHRKIVVIGGGPSGSTFALSLVERGVAPSDILIVDKAKFPRPKLCGGGVTVRGVEWVKKWLGDLPEGATTRELAFESSLGTIDVREEGPQWLVDRALLDHTLLTHAEEAGVEVWQESALVGLEGGPSAGEPNAPFALKIRREGTEHTLKADFVIGADGARGATGRLAGFEPAPTGLLMEAAFESVGELSVDPDVLVFDFDPIWDDIGGYAWIFPYPKPGSEGLFKLGIMDGRGDAKGRALRDWTMAYAERNGFRMVEPKLQGWPEQYFDPSRRVHRPGVLLTGEAWGIDPLLGEGIATSFEMAAYSACRVKDALDGGTRTITDYERSFCWTAEGRNLLFQRWLAARIYGPNARHWLRVLFRNRAMHRIGARGTERYGRLAKHGTAIAFSHLGALMRQGWPSNGPLQESEKVAVVRGSNR